MTCQKQSNNPNESKTRETEKEEKEKTGRKQMTTLQT